MWLIGQPYWTLQIKNIAIISESSLGQCCCKTFEDRVVSYSCASWGTCPMLGLKGQPADNQHLLSAPALLPVSVTGATHPHTCQPWPFLHLHSPPSQWPCCLFSLLVSLVCPLTCLYSSCIDFAAKWAVAHFYCPPCPQDDFSKRQIWLCHPTS